MGGGTLPGPLGISGQDTKLNFGSGSPPPAGGSAFRGPIGLGEASLPLDAGKAAAPQPPPATKPGTDTLNGIEVSKLADGTDGNIVGGYTTFNLDKGTTPGNNWTGPKKIISKLTGPPPVVKATIQTVYAPNAKPADPSAYGRGTTVDDRCGGTITLGFHESCHRQDYLDFIGANAPPKFGGRVGMTEAEYQAAERTYFAACDAYLKKALSHSKQKTDEVGSPTKSQYLKQNP